MTPQDRYGHRTQADWSSFNEEIASCRLSSRTLHAIDVEALVRLMVFNRLCDPSSKLGVLRWLETVSMPAYPPRPSSNSICCVQWAHSWLSQLGEQSQPRLAAPLGRSVLTL